MSPPPSPPRLSSELAERARTAIGTLDPRGAWVEDGRLRYHGNDDTTTQIIDCATFNRNVRTLADYIAAATK